VTVTQTTTPIRKFDRVKVSHTYTHRGETETVTVTGTVVGTFTIKKLSRADRYKQRKVGDRLVKVAWDTLKQGNFHTDNFRDWMLERFVALIDESQRESGVYCEVRRYFSADWHWNPRPWDEHLFGVRDAAEAFAAELAIGDTKEMLGGQICRLERVEMVEHKRNA